MSLARVALVVACAGCIRKTPSEIVVTVDTTYGVPCAIDTLHFEATSSAGMVSDDIAVTSSDLPGSFTLVPENGASDVTVTVTGMRVGVPFASATHELHFDNEVELELRVVLDASCLVGSGLPGPCDAVGVGRYGKLPSPQPRPGCGENGYALNTASLFAMHDACTFPSATSVLVSTDEAEAASPLAPPTVFPFWFYGTSITELWIGTNGYIGLGPGQPSSLTNEVGEPVSLGQSPRTFQGRGVLPFWDPLHTGPLGVCVATTGDPPNRLLWITWEEACINQGVACGNLANGILTFGAALEETTNRVYIGFVRMDGSGAGSDLAHGETATIGIADDVAPGCPATQCTNGLCADGVTLCGYTEYSAHESHMPPLPTLEFDPQ
ncbi:MAG TPA: hypothetical protein VMJ10_15065 [Kofleriaceae bacterium]|nr:hypothetical protein [Kofleriaceae bacterium]